MELLCAGRGRRSRLAGPAKALYLLALPAAIAAFMGLALLGNALAPAFSLGYSSYAARPLPILGPGLDELAFAISLTALLAFAWAAWIRRPAPRPRWMALTHMALPASSAIFYYFNPSLGGAALGLPAILASALTIASFGRLFGLRVATAASLTALALSAIYFAIGAPVAAALATSPDQVRPRIIFVAAQSLRQRLALVDVSLYYLAGPLTAWLATAIVMTPFWYPPLMAIRLAKALRAKGPPGLSVPGGSASPRGDKAGALGPLPYLALGLSVALGLYAAYYPGLHGSGPLGVDLPSYRELLGAGPNALARALLSGEYKAFYAIIPYAISEATGLGKDMALLMGPGVLAASMALASFSLAYSMTGDRWASALASALGVLSVQTAAGMYAAIYSGWLALALTYAFQAMALRSANLKGRPTRLAASAVALSLLALLAHPWTWGLAAAASAMTLLASAILVWKGLGNGLALRRLGFLVAAALAFDASLALAAYPLGSLRGELLSAKSILASLNPGRVADAYWTTYWTLVRFVGSAYFNPPVYAAALLGILVSLSLSLRASLVTAPFLLVAPAVALMAPPDLQWRALYAIPYHVYAALGLAWAARRSVGLNGQRGCLPGLAAAALCGAYALASFNNLLRYLYFLVKFFAHQ